MEVQILPGDPVIPCLASFPRPCFPDLAFEASFRGRASDYSRASCSPIQRARDVALQSTGFHSSVFRGRTDWVAAALALALLLTTATLHWPAANAQFTYDDRDFVERNQSIRSFAGATSAFFSPFPREQPERGLYRPLTNFSYAIDYALWGDTARGFHITNVWIYALAVVSVFSLALAYVPSLAFAGGVALAFSLHPVHTEAVDSVAGRSELLCLVFSLASLLFFLRALRQSTPWAAFASAGCMALACLSKETGAVLPGVLAVHALVFTRWEANTGAVRRVATCLRAIAPHAMILALYLLVRIASLGRFSPEHTVLGGGAISTRIHTMGAVFAEYARMLVFPRDLHVDYFYQHDPGIQIAASTQSVLGGVLLVSLAACACWLFARALRRSEGPDLGGLCLCALALLFAFFLPVSHVFDLGALLAERFVFAPSLGFLLAIGLPAAAWLGRSGLAVRATAVGLAIALSIVAAQRSRERADEWRDELRLWSTEAEASPADPRVLANLGAAQLHHSDYETARGPLVRALEIDPGHISALNNLAFANLHTGRLEEAAIRYQATLSIAANDFVAWNGLGVVATKQQDTARALHYFERAALLNPNYATAQRNLRAAREATSAAQRFLETHQPG